MEQKNKKKKGSGAAAAIVLLGLLGNLAEGDGIFAVVLLLTLGVIGAVVYVIVKAAKKAAPVTMAAKQEPCEFGKENHKFSHDANRRLSQLEGFYKDGIIDRKEYELLKQRWSK